MTVSRAKTEYMCMSGVCSGSVRLQDHQLPEVKEFTYLESMLQTDGGIEAKLKDTIRMEKLEEDGWCDV